MLRSPASMSFTNFRRRHRFTPETLKPYLARNSLKTQAHASAYLNSLSSEEFGALCPSLVRWRFRGFSDLW
jgi:hypothetical protein